ncbi:MAG: ATP-binding cassette domain-containing protein [Gammaproteobacteria bacterium]|nr:ATP-binding cassette domain-containing protein [Gammaproteobacteria bacterium]
MKSPKLRLPRSWLRYDILLASLGINLFALGIPIVTLQIYDRILPNKAHETLGFLIAALIGIAILDGFLRISRAVILAWKGAAYEHRQSLSILRHILSSDLVSFESRPKGVYLDRFQALEQVREFYCGHSILLMLDLPFVFVFLGLIWLFAGNLVLIPVAVILVFLVVSVFTGLSLRSALQRRSESDERRQNFTIESLQGIHSIKAMVMEPQMMRRYERLQGQSADAIYVLTRATSMSQALGVTFSQLVMVSFLTIGSIVAVSGQLSIGALAAGTLLAGRVLQLAMKALALWTHFQTARLARDKVSELLALPTEHNTAQSDVATLSGAIDLVNVSFCHEGSQQQLLNNVCLHIAAGESVGITGANGVGKSTLLHLIMGFVRPTSGQILLDGKDLETLDRSSVRSQIGFAPQRGMLFDGTLLENMTLFREGDAVDNALALARKLNLDTTITHLPEGLDTRVGSSTVDSLPEGFRQRLIVVRALVGDVKIVLFDDANSGFDDKDDVRLVALLEELKQTCTLVLVSHRPSLLKLCERGYRLDETGVHLMFGHEPSADEPQELGDLARAS